MFSRFVSFSRSKDFWFDPAYVDHILYLVFFHKSRNFVVRCCSQGLRCIRTCIEAHLPLLFQLQLSEKTAQSKPCKVFHLLFFEEHARHQFLLTIGDDFVFLFHLVVQLINISIVVIA